MQETLQNIKAIYEALNTIQVSNHQQIKTFSNCLDLMVYTINQINEKIDQDNQQQKVKKEVSQ